MARSLLAWFLLGCMVLAGLSFVVDAALLVHAGSPTATILATCTAVASLGAILALVAVLPSLALQQLASVLERRGRRGRLAWCLLVSTAAFAVTWTIVEPTGRTASAFYAALAVLSGIAIGLTAALRYSQPRYVALIALALIGAVPLAVDLALAGNWYVEIHETADLIVIAALYSAVLPLHGRLRTHSLRTLVFWSLFVVAGSLSMIGTVDDVAPGWRTASMTRARNAVRYLKLLHRLTDLDGDGFSPILWGGDCDDGDDTVHPGAADPPGGRDSNCNGVDPPAEASEEARGLAPAVGSASLPQGAVSLCVLVTVDALRADVFVPGLMPNAGRFAATGARLLRTYPAATHTTESMEAVFRADEGHQLVATTLADRGIVTSAVAPRMDAFAELEGFRHTDVRKVDANAVTDAAIARIDAVGPRPHFLWVHYYDVHSPDSHEAIETPAALPELPVDYRKAVIFTDRAIGRLFDHLAHGGYLERALVVLTSDHGELLGEHGITHHATSGYTEVVRVPGVMIAPGVTPGRYRQLFSHRGLPATVLGGFGLGEESLRAERFGRSWLRIVDAPKAPLQRFVVTRSHRFNSGRMPEPNSHLAIIEDVDHRLVVGIEDGLTELFDVRRDPGDSRDLSATHFDVLRRLRTQVHTFAEIDRYPR